MRTNRLVHGAVVGLIILCSFSIAKSTRDPNRGASIRFHAFQRCGQPTPHNVYLYVSSLNTRRTVITKQALRKPRTNIWQTTIRLSDGAYQFFATSPKCSAIGNVYITGPRERTIVFEMKPEIVLVDAIPTIYGNIAIHGANVAASCDVNGHDTTLLSRSDGVSYSIDVPGDESSCRLILVFGNVGGAMITKNAVWKRQQPYARLDITYASLSRFEAYSPNK